ncbi:MAG: CHAD domain-containing protein [Thaumarchaeota archaeon]|nr:CHAD domain-containing protein [Nitrososphaerota archaeon]
MSSLFQRVKRVESELKNYLADPSEEHDHDIRTSIRKLEASFDLLPKKVRKKDEKFYSQLAKLLKMNTQVRDIDVMLRRLSAQKQRTLYLERLQHSLEGEKAKSLSFARKEAELIAKLEVARLSADSISQKKA